MELKAGYKQSDAGILPEGWEAKSLHEGVQLLSGYHILAKDCNTDGKGVPYITGPADFPNGTIQHTKFTEKPGTVCRAGDILITVKGSGAGTLVVADAAYCISRQLMAIRVNGWNQSFVYLSLLHNTSLFEAAATGLIPGLSRQDILKKQMAIPSLPEQRAIAAALSDVDTLIRSLAQLIAKKRDLKQASMHQLLTGRQRLPGFHGEWERKRIGTFTDCISGGTPSTSVPTFWGGQIRWMSSGELHLKRVRDVEGRITEEGLRSSSAKMIPEECILIGLAGQGKTRGTVAMNLVPLCTNQSIAAVLPSPTFVPEYLYYNLDARYDELRGLSTGDGGRGGLNLTIIKSLSVPIPEIEEQRAIATVLSVYSALRNGLFASLGDTQQRAAMRQ